MTHDTPIFERHGVKWRRLPITKHFELARAIHAGKRAKLVTNLKDCGIDGQAAFQTLTQFDMDGASIGDDLVGQLSKPDVLEMVLIASIRMANNPLYDDAKVVLEGVMWSGDAISGMFELAYEILGLEKIKPEPEPAIPENPSKIPPEKLPAFAHHVAA